MWSLTTLAVDLAVVVAGVAALAWFVRWARGPDRACPHCGAADAGYGDLDTDYGPSEAGYEPGARLDCAACGGPIVIAADGSFRADVEGGAPCPR